MGILGDKCSNSSSSSMKIHVKTVWGEMGVTSVLRWSRVVGIHEWHLRTRAIKMERGVQVCGNQQWSSHCHILELF